VTRYINGYGQLVPGPLLRDPEPWPPAPHRPPRLTPRNVRYDVQECPEGYWATACGALLRIRAMSDRHLLNALWFLEIRARRRARYEALKAGMYEGGEMAEDVAHEVSDELFMASWDPNVNLRSLARLVWPKYKELEAERLRRGLAPISNPMPYADPSSASYALSAPNQA
jgi:hypothetical protein